MTGKILGYDVSTEAGTISGEDGKRYKFTKENWKENNLPIKEAKVDFDVSQEGNAVDIYQVRDTVAENNDMMMVLIAIAITFFFGFIGTFVSLVVLAKQPVGKAIMPTVLHFLATLLALIPIVGWFIYILVTLYYMFKNYKAVVNSTNLENKYA
jgi:hypothetical protein